MKEEEIVEKNIWIAEGIRIGRKQLTEEVLKCFDCDLEFDSWHQMDEDDKIINLRDLQKELKDIKEKLQNDT